MAEIYESVEKEFGAPKPLYKEDAIKYTVMMEEKKLKCMGMADTKAEEDDMDSEDKDEYMSKLKDQAFDELWCEHGIEEDQIEDAAERYEWENDV
jgi:hypothetical protein